MQIERWRCTQFITEGSQKCKISELNLKGKSTKDNSTMNYGYIGSAQFVYPKGDKKADYFLPPSVYVMCQIMIIKNI